MKGYVLFSPLGKTDPIRDLRDGAFLHICRKYRPEKAYLYLSKEICCFDETDDRYAECLRLLCEKDGFLCDAEKLRRPELTDVHDFDYFYGEFESLLKRISAENPDHTLLLNVSSGTPQMMAALLVLCRLLPVKTIPIQVATPAGKSNTSRTEEKNFDIETTWELNEDNLPGSPDRCTEVGNTNLLYLLQRETILRHLAAYDYHAALTSAGTVSEMLPGRACGLIEAGALRLGQDAGNAQRIARQAGYELMPVRETRIVSSKAVMAFEYILMLGVKLKKEEYADFLRGVSPVLTDLFEIYLTEKCGIPITGYYDNRSGKLRGELLPEELKSILDESFPGGYKDSVPCAANLLPLILKKGRLEDAELAMALRKAEEEGRNVAAHEIVAVNDKWIRDHTGVGAHQILRMLQEFLAVCMHIPDGAWDSYDRLNDKIRELLL